MYGALLLYWEPFMSYFLSSFLRSSNRPTCRSQSESLGLALLTTLLQYVVYTHLWLYTIICQLREIIIISFPRLVRTHLLLWHWILSTRDGFQLSLSLTLQVYKQAWILHNLSLFIPAVWVVLRVLCSFFYLLNVWFVCAGKAVDIYAKFDVIVSCRNYN